MAQTQKAALPAKLLAEMKELKDFRKLASKELTALRRGLADALGTAEAAKAALDEIREEVKEANARTKKLVADPIYSVPQELKRRAETLEADVKKLRTQMAGRATQDQLDKAQEEIAKLRGNVDEAGETLGDHGDRLVLLEEALTKPEGAEHADPPAHPSPAEPERADPRQTTLDDAIARNKRDMEGSPADDSPDDAEETNEHDEDDDAGEGAAP